MIIAAQQNYIVIGINYFIAIIQSIIQMIWLIVTKEYIGCLMFGVDYVLPTSIPFVLALNFYMVGIQNAVWTFGNTLGLFRQRFIF